MVDPLSGDVLDVGRRSRWFTDEIRAASAVRDGGCVFKGCDAHAAQCDAHHVRHWRRGGRTNLENGALLCRHHHGVVHRQGWSLETDASTGWLVVTTPDGRRIETQRHGPTRAPTPVTTAA